MATPCPRVKPKIITMGYMDSIAKQTRNGPKLKNTLF